MIFRNWKLIMSSSVWNCCVIGYIRILIFQLKIELNFKCWIYSSFCDFVRSWTISIGSNYYHSIRAFVSSGMKVKIIFPDVKTQLKQKTSLNFNAKYPGTLLDITTRTRLKLWGLRYRVVELVLYCTANFAVSNQINCKF